MPYLWIFGLSSVLPYFGGCLELSLLMVNQLCDLGGIFLLFHSPLKLALFGVDYSM